MDAKLALATPALESLSAAASYFADTHRAYTTIAALRWPNGVRCPVCGSDDARYLASYDRFQCNRAHHKRQFTVKTGTVMEGSHLGLDKWAVALWAAEHAPDVSSYELSRVVGVTQKSSWLLMKRIRQMRDVNISLAL